MIKVLLFDADDVLINGNKFADTLHKDYGVDREKTSLFFKGKFVDCLVGKADLKKEIEPYLNQWNWHKSVEEFFHYWFTSEHTINEPLIEYIKKLQAGSIECFIATNQEKNRTGYILNEMGFGDVFDGCFSSADVGFVKPQEDFYLAILHKLTRVLPEEILFWDDRMDNVEMARKVGMNAEVFSNFEEFEKKMKKYQLAS
jgi:putative hydrolase of the HAD superfamily